MPNVIESMQKKIKSRRVQREPEGHFHADLLQRDDVVCSSGGHSRSNYPPHEGLGRTGNFVSRIVDYESSDGRLPSSGHRPLNDDLILVFEVALVRTEFCGYSELNFVPWPGPAVDFFLTFAGIGSTTPCKNCCIPKGG